MHEYVDVFGASVSISFKSAFIHINDCSEEKMWMSLDEKFLENFIKFSVWHLSQKKYMIHDNKYIVVISMLRPFDFGTVGFVSYIFFVINAKLKI